MRVAFTLFCLGCVIRTLQATSWHERKRLHKLRTLRADRMIRLGKMSDGNELEYFKNEILKPFLRVRVPGTQGNKIVQQHIKTKMTSFGWTIEEDAFNDTTPMGKKPFTNIIAVHNASATRRLTLACHFDSKYFADFDFIGATDSAVPCALLIDLARLLNGTLSKASNSELTLQFIFFDGEEAFINWTPTDSIYGARHLAAKMENTFIEVEREVTVSQLETIDLFVLLDLIGTEDTTFINYFSQTSKYFERLQKIEMRLGKESILEPAENFKNRRSNKYFSGTYTGYDNGIQDDHIPFMQRNVPILHLISSPFPRVWHKRDDNESALHYPTINNIGKILRIFVVEYLHRNIS